MYYYIYAEKDATIYSDKTKDSHIKNTGIDEIIELHKVVPPFNDKIENSRILLKFDITEISKSLSSGIIKRDANFDLRLFTARPSQLPLSYVVEAHPISQSWSATVEVYRKLLYFPSVLCLFLILHPTSFPARSFTANGPIAQPKS